MKPTLILKVLAVCALGLSLCGCSNSSNDNTPDNMVTYTLLCDKTQADVKEPITFTVKSSTGQDVTAMWTFWDENFCFESNVISYDFPGSHTIVAYSQADNSLSTNTVTVTINGDDQYDYYRRTLFMKWTATWCPACPSMETALEEIMDMPAYQDRIVPVALHCLENDYCYVGPGIGDMFNSTAMDYYIEYIPTCVVDFDSELQVVGAEQPAMQRLFDKSLSRVPYSKTPGLAIETSLDGRELSFTIKYNVREDGEYLLGCYFIEDGVQTYQSGAPNNRMVQNHVIHASLTDGVSTFGLYDCGYISVGYEFEYSSSYNIPIHQKPADFVLDNCQLVYFICKKDSSVAPYKYYCANVATVKVGESAGYEYESVQ